jgi:PAS domain S-box-containing protein
LKRSDDGEAKGPAFGGALAIVLYALEIAAVAAAVFGLTYSSRLLPAVNPAETPLWPPTGVALAIVLLRGYRIWPAILIGSFLAGGMAGRPHADSACIAVAILGAAFAGTYLIERWAHGRNAFAAPLDVVKFALICFVPTALVGTVLIIAGFFLSGTLNTAQKIATAITWFLGDAARTVVHDPRNRMWAATSLRPFAKWSVLEAAAIFAAAAVIGMAAFSPLVDGDLGALLPYRSLLGVLILLPLTWSALRGNQRNAATAALIFCGMAVWGFSEGASPFAKADLDGARLLLFVILVSTSVVPLVVATAAAVRRDTETHLLSVQEQLNRKIAETNKALDSAKRHFQILIEGVVDYAIFVLDTAGRVASWNSAAQQIIGYTAEEIIGKHFGIFYRPDERRAGEPNRALELAVQKDKHEVEGWRIRKNGTLVFVTGSVSVIRDDSGNLIGFANVIRDATERRDAQEKLVEAREQLAMAQKMEAIGKLTGGIAHDFNNLLMIIGGNAQMFKRLLDPKLPRAIEAIQTAAKRGESLTRQLLTFSRRQHLSPTVVDLGTCIRSMRPMIESSLRGNIVYNEKIAAEVAPVKVDQAELELAIVNIAVNARDAMPTGGSFTLSIGNVTEAKDPSLDQLVGSFVALSFSDSGMGIPPNLLTKIFDPFFTTKEVGKGTGLGLSQVYGFAHQAGGTVRAESKVGQGTMITVYLPASAAGETAVKDTAARDSAQSLRPTVLVVDDSAEVAQVTSSLFEHLGFNTVYRDSAEAALKLLADGTKLDLVFSDIVMPGTIDGVGLASEIRSHYPEVPVVLTTGYSDAAQSVPPDLPILRKPFDTDALRGFIRDTVDVRLTA